MRDGWLSAVIGDYCEVMAGQSPAGSAYNDTGRGTPFYQGKKDFTEKYIGEPTAWTTEISKTAEQGDILMSVRAPVGPVNFATRHICIGRGLAAIRCKPTMDREFLFYQLQHLQPKIAGKEGAVFASINKSEIASLPIVVAPLSEQKRIVATLDQAFKAIDKAQTNAETNEHHVQALFASCLNQSLTKLHSESRVASVGELVSSAIIEKPQDGNHGEIHPTKADYVSQGVPFLMAADLKGGGVDTTSCRFISDKQARSLRIGFAKNADVLLSHKGTIGRVAVLSTELNFVILTPQITYYRVLNSKVLNNRYLYYYFQSEPFQNDLRGIAGAGSTRAYIGITRQLDLKILVPPIEKQHSLVKLLEDVEGACALLKSIYRQKVTRVSALKQSVLASAFGSDLSLAA